MNSKLAIRFLKCFILICCLQNSANAQQYDIILGRPTDTSITASVMFYQNADVYIEYGTQTGNYPNTTLAYSCLTKIPNEIDLHNLVPNTKYYYRLKYRGTGTNTYLFSPEYYFQTQRLPGSSFTFTIEADEHLYDKKGVINMYNVTLDNEAKDNPDFMLSLGDIFGDDHSYLDHTYTITAGEIDTLHYNYRPLLGQICHSIPFFIALGNHEGERKHHFSFPIPAPNNMPVNATLARKKYYPNPSPNNFYAGDTTHESWGIGNPENYYSWTWGDALFVVLDPYRYDSRSDTSAKPTGWDWTLGITQYLWLKKTLETSTAKYKFVFAHHIRGEGRGGITNAITNEWGGYQRVTGTTGNGYTFDANRPASEGWTKPIHQLFIDNHVNIFFQGHDHVFAHEMLDGITYQACPMAADSTYEIGMLANADAYTADTLDGTGHIKVTVTPSCVKVDYVRAYLPADTMGVHKNREIALSYTIGDCIITPCQFTYGNWSVCDSSGFQTRTYTSLPAGCTGTPPTDSIRRVCNIATTSDFVSVFPNPAKTVINLRFNTSITNLQTELINSIGQAVFKGNANSIDVSKYSTGVYFLKINSDQGNTIKKILIQH
jgi:Secretion system C-terminal sorting domain/Calcineurin-like phosphoesterase